MVTKSIPAVIDAQRPLNPEELEVLRRQYEREGSNASIQTKFNYAWGLVCSNKKEHIEHALSLLSDIYTNAPERRRECLYYLALGNHKLSNYMEARQYVSQLLRLEPMNAQAAELEQMITTGLSRESLVGLAIIATTVAAGVALSIMLFRRSSK